MQFERVRSVLDVLEVEDILTFLSRVPDVCLIVIGPTFIRIGFGSLGRSSHSSGAHMRYDLSQSNHVVLESKFKSCSI